MEAPSLAKMKLSVVKHLKARTATETAACVMNANICIGSQHNACVMIEGFCSFFKKKENIRTFKILDFIGIKPQSNKDQR